MAVQEHHRVILKRDIFPQRLYHNYRERSSGVSHSIADLIPLTLSSTPWRRLSAGPWTQELLLQRCRLTRRGGESPQVLKSKILFLTT